MLPAPIRIGPFLVDEQGHTQLHDGGNEASFTFAWRGSRFSVRLAEGVLMLRAQAGRVPSTADGAGKRQAVLATLRALPQILPAGLGLKLSPEHRVLLETSDAQGLPSTAAGLLVPVIGLLLRLAPVIDLLEEAGLQA